MKNKLPKISIIVPIYGVELYIEDCLRSVINQDYQGELECILVNDCTPDNSMRLVSRVLASYNGRIDFLVIHHDRNGGLSAARNTGMKHSTGEYIYFLDSDDEITSNCCSVLAEPLLQRSYDMVIADYITVGTEKQFPQLMLPDGEILDRHEIVKMRFMDCWYQMAVNKLYRKDFLKRENLTFKEGLIHEDELWSAEVACLLTSMYVVKSSQTYIYKIRENSITTNNNYQRQLNAFSVIVKELSAFIQAHGMGTDKYVVQLLLSMFYIAVGVAIRTDKNVYMDYYPVVRKEANIPFCPLLKYNGLNLKKQIRDLHFLMPTCVAKKYYWWALDLFTKIR